MEIAILGREPDTANYAAFVKGAGCAPVVTLDPLRALCCKGVIFPGGGDITPAFFGEQNRGSLNIDTELDILQLETFSRCVKSRRPVLGICKGIQLINVGLGGALCQDMPTARLHRYDGGDQYHATVIEKGSWLHALYGSDAVVNSAHHQSIRTLAPGLAAVQRCPQDGCIEAVCHSELPILGVQWHPERLSEDKTTIRGADVMTFFLSLLPECPL